ncbi:MAG: PAAR domain-containing protein [Rhodospirillaceae bacterium]|nr:MAG: PAAR domain-containing protein [Rhodospirillaceae bacterium]
MASEPVCRLGDVSDHGGTLITASSTVKTDGIAACRDQDLHDCPLPGHGVTPVTGTGIARLDGGRPRVRIGDVAGCGAAMSSGSPTTTCE